MTENSILASLYLFIQKRKKINNKSISKIMEMQLQSSFDGNTTK